MRLVPWMAIATTIAASPVAEAQVTLHVNQPRKGYVASTMKTLKEPISALLNNGFQVVGDSIGGDPILLLSKGQEVVLCYLQLPGPDYLGRGKNIGASKCLSLSGGN